MANPGTPISVNGNSFQTDNIGTANIDHHGSPEFNATVLAIAHANASAIPYVDWPKKVIPIDGQLFGVSSLVALDQLEDTFKSYLTARNFNLDVGYAGTTRRYTCLSVTKIAINRPQELWTSKFNVEFTCMPFGADTSATTLFTSGAQTGGSYTATPTFGGTAPYQYPIFTYTLGSSATSTTNLVTNPGFETNTTGWSSGGIGTFTRTTGQFHSGIAAGQMVNAASSPLTVPQTNTYGWELYPVSGLTVGQIYTVSLWVKGNAGGEVFGTESLGSGIINRTLTTSWQQVTFNFTATATTDQIYVWSTTASATWFIDDVSIVVNSAATVSIGNGNNGQAILVTRVWSPNDVLVIDTTQLLNTPGVSWPVTVNGSPVTFSGAFPEFPPGLATISYSDTFISRSFVLGGVNTNRYM